jgi:hypothetical protein
MAHYRIAWIDHRTNKQDHGPTCAETEIEAREVLAQVRANDDSVSLTNWIEEVSESGEVRKIYVKK